MTSDTDAHCQIEAAGAHAGINPMFGEWRQTFDFAPVAHRGSGGAARQAFQDRIRASLRNRFLYWGEVQVTITLFLDIQTVLETSETADVDNYAKSILDALKGPEGVFIDDTQVQALNISWIDSASTYFEVDIRASPDDFKIKPLAFYEMPDGLFYPQASNLWEPTGPKTATDFDVFAGLSIIEMMTAAKRHIRHVLREAGFTRLQASRSSAYFQTALRGFHLSRLAESGFVTIRIADWRASRDAWRTTDPEKAAFLDQTAAEHGRRHAELAAALAKVGPKAIN